MPFVRPTLSQLVEQARTEIETGLDGADSRLRRSFLDVLVRLSVAQTNGAYGYLDWIAKQSIPDTATEENLRRWTALFGVPEVPATFAAGSIEVEGTNGTVIPEDTALRRADTTEYRTVAEATISGGAVSVDVVALEAGIAGNAEVGVTLQFVSPILGANVAATVDAEISGGTDAEDEESLLQRLIDRLQTPPGGGTIADYERQARLVPGVTTVFVYAGTRDDETIASSIGTTVDSEVNGAWMARGAVTRVKVIVHWRSANLANSEVVSLALNLQDATDGAGAGAADFGTPIAGVTLYTAPGSGGPHTVEAVYETIIDVAAARAFLREQHTVTTSAAATATIATQIELEGDDGVVHVAPLFYDREDPIPLAGDLEDVEEVLGDDEFKPVTAVLDVYAVTAVPVDFEIESADDPAMQANVEAELRDLFRREAEPGGVVLISHIREAISSAAGETDHELITPTANIDLGGDLTELSTVGDFTWTTP